MPVTPRVSRFAPAALLLLLTACSAPPTRTWSPSPSTTAAATVRANPHLEAGLSARARGDDTAALNAFSLALLDNPKLTAAYMGIGSIYLDQGDYGQAQKNFAEAAEIEPDNPQVQYRYGLSLHKAGDIDAAVGRYLAALNLQPQNFLANRELASAYLQRGEPDTALPYALNATRLRPESQPAWSNLAATYSLLGRYDQAIDAYRTANELGELADPVLLGLADAHIRLGNFPRAINTLNSLIQSSPSATAHERLGFAYFKLRRFEDALTQYESGLTLDRRDLASLNGAGACYMTLYIEANRENTDHRDRALQCWRTSVRMQPDQPRIVDLLSRYGRL